MKTLYGITLFVLLSHQAFPQLSPDFYPANHVIKCGPVDVYFGCFSPANPSMVKWDFGDGTSSGLINPMHSYTTPGNYTVKLYVEKNGKSDSLIRQDFVIIKPRPAAQFVEEPIVPLEPMRKRFVDQSSHYADSMVRYTWGVNDTRYEGKGRFTFTFHDSGSYRISLTVENNRGCTDSAERTVYISNWGPVEPVGLSPLKDHSRSFSIYPNPSSSILYMRLPQNSKILSVKDIRGRDVLTIKTDSFISTVTALDLSDLETGFYFLETVVGLQTYRQKFYKTG